MTDKEHGELVTLQERLRRNADTLRYFLNWSDRPRTQIGTLYSTFSRDPGDDYTKTAKERLETLYADIGQAADALDARDKRIEVLEGALRNCIDEAQRDCPLNVIDIARAALDEGQTHE